MSDKTKYKDIELIEKELFKLADDMSKEYRDAIDDCINTIDAVPTADVVPKSEYIQQIAEVQGLREAIREIFEEIEKLSHKFMNDEHYIFGDMVWDIAELKKKYTKGGAE